MRRVGREQFNDLSPGVKPEDCEPDEYEPDPVDCDPRDC